MHRIRMLRHYGVVPMMVFDGGPLPAKKGTEVERAKWVLDSYMAGMGGYDLLNASPDPPVGAAKRVSRKRMPWQLKEDQKKRETFTRNALMLHLRWHIN
jgi:hypothetical protein